MPEREFEGPNACGRPAVSAAGARFADDGLLALTQLLGIVSADVQPFGDEQ
jgi:hypothetical protein